MQVSQKYRLTVFIALVMLLCTWSVMYSVEAYTMMYSVDGLPDKVNNINIDGSDFTGLFKLGALALEGFLDSFIMITYIIIMVFWSALLLLIFSLISIRKASTTSKSEIKYAKIALCSFTLIAYVTALILTKFSAVLTALLLLWPIPLFGTLFYILPLKFRYKKSNEATQHISFDNSQIG